MGIFAAFRIWIRSKSRSQWRSESEKGKDPSKWMFLNELKVFNDAASTWAEKEGALMAIGHCCYTGGHLCSELIEQFIPTLITIISGKSPLSSLRLQCIKTLTEVCYCNKELIDQVQTSNEFRQVLPSLLNNYVPSQARWTCYLISIMTAHSIAFLIMIKRIPYLFESIEAVAAYPHDWRAFGYNIAKRIVALQSGDVTPLSLREGPMQLKSISIESLDINNSCLPKSISRFVYSLPSVKINPLRNTSSEAFNTPSETSSIFKSKE